LFFGVMILVLSFNPTVTKLQLQASLSHIDNWNTIDRNKMENRPDPDELLKHVESEEPNRGKLKIFLGYVAGVGKTYAMLEAAHQRKAQGLDVVVGYIETHKRAETEELVAGLEVLPRKQVEYHNVNLPELDVDTVLNRRPQLVLVDEFAHTNAPGSRHPKRFQDVAEILDAGIDVYTTLNIQHLESLNDIVAQVTGIIVRETVPDRVIDEASEIEVIDLPPDELLLLPCVKCPCAAPPNAWIIKCAPICRPALFLVRGVQVSACLFVSAPVRLQKN
jgi:hypothetical protein